jgi:hypothetical protein
MCKFFGLPTHLNMLMLEPAMYIMNPFIMSDWPGARATCMARACFIATCAAEPRVSSSCAAAAAAPAEAAVVAARTAAVVAAQELRRRQRWRSGGER